jgi:hypothetical protein
MSHSKVQKIQSIKDKNLNFNLYLEMIMYQNIVFSPFNLLKLFLLENHLNINRYILMDLYAYRFCMIVIND